MTISLSINAPDRAAVDRFVARAASFLPPGGIVHIDAGDGSYTPAASWDDPAEWGAMKGAIPSVFLEVHLMALDWETRLVPWLEAGAKRVIVQIDLVRDARHLLDVVGRYGASAMLSIPPLVSADAALAHQGTFREFQVLAVPPGRSGQAFDPGALGKISSVRAAFPDAIIELDGGVTPDILRPAKAAGADIAVSASYIWNAADPKTAYEELAGI